MLAVARLVAIALMAGAAPLYHGPALDLMPLPAELHPAGAKVAASYPLLARLVKVNSKSAWRVIYRRPTAKEPVWTTVNVLVFATTAEAKSYWQRAAKPSFSNLKFHGPTYVTGIEGDWAVARRSGLNPAYYDLSTCHNLVVLASSTGPESLRALGNEAGYAASECYVRAIAFGMPLCTKK